MDKSLRLEPPRTGQPFAAAFPAFHENEVTRLLAGLSLQGLQLSVPFLLCRIDFDVVMHFLPPSRFPAIDVGDALLKGDRLSSESHCTNLAAYLEGQITHDPDQGVSQDDRGLAA